MNQFYVYVMAFLTAMAGCNAPADGPDDPLRAAHETRGCNEFLGFESVQPQPVVVLETNLGTMEAEICEDLVPITAGNFLAHVRNGFYDGTKFHRIITDFMMQGGDPNSKDDDPSDDGRGGVAADGSPSIRDEFHPRLHHFGEGVFSMANAGPNTGSSQFFITYKATPHLDGKHAIFGMLTKGFDVLDYIHETAGSVSGTPERTVVLEKAWVKEAEGDDAPTDFLFWSPRDHIDVATNGGTARFLLVLNSQVARTLEAGNVTVEAPNGVDVVLEERAAQMNLRAGGGAVLFLDATVGRGGGDPLTISVTASFGGKTVQLDLTMARSGDIGPRIVEQGDRVTADYIGLLTSGLLFDTSVEEVAKFVDGNNLGYKTFNLRPAYSPFQFTPGSGVIQGFTDLAIGTLEGAAAADRIPPADAYGTTASQQNPLGGKTLIFDLHVRSIA
ncbi:MAG: peptidylprolyl isomerase [Thermoplasmatota archaeon]